MSKRHHRQGGYLLVECVAYIAVLVVIMAVGFQSYLQSRAYSRDMARTSDGIISAMNAGELWREDIRKAAGTPSLVEGRIEIPQKSGKVTYVLLDGKVRRITGQSTESTVLSGVKNSRFCADRRKYIQSWRWEVELLNPKTRTILRPAFTFQAVAAGARK
jgi:hypothetical protein